MITDNSLFGEEKSVAVQPDSAIPRRRRLVLGLVRWGLIAVCALLIGTHPHSAAVLGPLLVIAAVLGTRRARSRVMQGEAAAKGTPKRRAPEPR